MKVGDKVKAGDSLMVMIAMKMEVMKSQVHLSIKLWELSDLIVFLPYFVS